MIKELFKFEEIRRLDSVETVVSTNTFTSSKKEYTHDSLVYSPVAIGRSREEDSSEVSKANLKLKFSINNTFAYDWMDKDDSILRLQRYKVEDPTVTATWKGRLVSTESDGKYITLVFESIFSSMRNYGLKRVFQRTCNHALFSAECGLSRATYAVTGTIAAFGTSDSRELLVTASGAFANDYFTFGTIVDSDGNSRMISDHAASTITMAKRCLAFEEEFASSGAVNVTIYPGCDKSRSTCDSKYLNSINFGAFPYMPIKDYFDKILVI